MRGRTYHARIDFAYLGGALPEDECRALTVALQRSTPEASLSVATESHSSVTVTATLRADSPLEAIANLTRCVDQALFGTGLFEEFDATGRTLHVAPEAGMNSVSLK
jgi:hypothetical protein